MPAPRPVVLVDAAKAAPVEYEIAGGVAARPLTISAIFNGAAAAATFLPCCSIYAPGGELLSRTFPDGGIGAGDSAEVTFAPFLRSQQQSTPTPSGMDLKYVPPSSISLPVLELAFESNNLWASATPVWTLDAGYPHNGYLQLNANGAYIAWPIVFGPQGSQWLPIPVLAEGPDHGIVKLEIGTAEWEDDGNGWPGTFEAYSDVATFVTIQTMDRYAAALNKFPGSSQIANTFQVTGDDGAVGTSYSSFQWNGGSGPAFVRLRVDGKNAASAGFRFQLSAFYMCRVDNLLII